MISLVAVPDIPIITSVAEFWESLGQLEDRLVEDDILVVAHTPWSRISGYSYTLDEVIASPQAEQLARQLDKDPRHVEIILRESTSVVKTGQKVIVTENKAGVVCANGGIDQSNAGLGKLLAVPHDPDQLAREIRSFVRSKFGIRIAVIISDTVGRALRRGAVNIGIGVAGMAAMRSEKGKRDLFGYTMQVSEVAVIDELASAAELLQGQTDEGRPFVIIRGFGYEVVENASARSLNRPERERIFK